MFCLAVVALTVPSLRRHNRSSRMAVSFQLAIKETGQRVYDKRAYYMKSVHWPSAPFSMFAKGH